MKDEARAKRQTNRWPGVSCTSWWWPHTQDNAEFEIRRAVANIARDLERIVLEETNRNDVLHILDAVRAAQDAVERTLRIVVAEAIACGATWKDIGEHLGVQRTAAQKRFREGLNSQEMELASAEFGTFATVMTSWHGSGALQGFRGDEFFGFDDEDWVAVPPIPALQYALRQIPRSAAHLKGALLNWADGKIDAGLILLHRGGQALLHATGILMTGQAMEALRECIDEYRSESELWVDESSNTYFVHAACLTATAYWHFNAARREKGCEQMKHFMLACTNMDEAAATIARPECLAVIAIIEKKARDGGDEVYNPIVHFEESDKDYSDSEYDSFAYRKPGVEISSESLEMEAREVFFGLNAREVLSYIDELKRMESEND